MTYGLPDTDAPVAASGGRCEFTHWMESARPALLSYTKRHLLKVVHGNHDAEDILQDALCVTWKRRDDLGCLGADRLSHWTMRVIRNRVIDLARQATARNEAPAPRQSETSNEDEGVEALDSLPKPRSACCSEPSPWSDEVHYALTSLRTLGHEEHLCLVLRDLMGLDWSMVAAALGRSVEGAKGLRKRTRRKLLREE